MNTNELVSVIIPAFNHEKYIKECIQSIIDQTYQNIELLVIDDGSTDTTWKKIQEMRPLCKERFTRVYVETKKNEGTCVTLNKLISLAKGRYIYIIASDDKAKSQAVEKEASFLKANPEYVVAVGDNEIIDSNSNRVGWDRHKNPVAVDSAKYKTFSERSKIADKKDNFGMYQELLKTNHVPNGYLILASALKQITFVPEAPLEDYFMHLQLSKLGKYKFIPEILLSYRWHSKNTVKNKKLMSDMIYKTLLFEQKSVNTLKDKKWKKLFDENINRIKIKFCIGKWIKFYRIKNIDYKQNVLELFHFKFYFKKRYFIA